MHGGLLGGQTTQMEKEQRVQRHQHGLALGKSVHGKAGGTSESGVTLDTLRRVGSGGESCCDSMLAGRGQSPSLSPWQ